MFHIKKNYSRKGTKRQDITLALPLVALALPLVAVAIPLVGFHDSLI